MYFLIDHENVKSNGYKGISFLLPEDTMEIFFSECCKNIPRGIFQDMQESGCEIKICKLHQPRKNALDFYITSRLGELIGGGFHGNAAIISEDQGFKSVQEYWRECTTAKRRICLAPTIADAIISTNEPASRTQMLREQMKKVSLEAEFARYEENTRIRKLLKKHFEHTEFADRLDEIEEVFQKKHSRKILYLNSLKRFGKKDGISIYHYMKELAV